MGRRGSRDKPKRALNAYNIFLKEMKNLNGAKHLSFAEFSKLCSDRWRSLSYEEKQVFQEKADEDKIRYKYEMQYFGPSAVKKKVKRPLTGFMYYCQVERPRVKLKHPRWSAPQLVRELARKWREVSLIKKSKYTDLARKEWSKYRKQQRKMKNESPPLSASSTGNDSSENSFFSH